MMPQIRFVLSIMVWFFCKIDSYLSPEYDCDLLAELSKFTTAIFTQNGPGWKKLVFGVKIATLQSLTGPVQGRIYYTGKTLFWPCTGPVRDCSVDLYDIYYEWIVEIYRNKLENKIFWLSASCIHFIQKQHTLIKLSNASAHGFT